jgi:raffinose/stachyose/melibiose transport system substrate-binding protein
MNFKPLLVCALLVGLPSFAQTETVVKILHLQTNPKIIAIWKDAAQTYEKTHPGVKIQFNYLENEAFKAKLSTLLQSKDRPSAFHSWGGGVMYEQVGSDICQDITAAAGDFKDTFYPATIQNFTVEGKMYGLPNDLGPIVFWYNGFIDAAFGRGRTGPRGPLAHASIRSQRVACRQIISIILPVV